MEEQERVNRRKSIFITILVQVLVLTVLYLMTAWKAPFPPIEEFGIELSFVSGGSQTAPRAPRAAPVVETSASEEADQEDIQQETTTDEAEPPEELEGNDEVLPAEAEEENEQASEAQQDIEESEAKNDQPEGAELESEQQEQPSAPVIDERALYRKAGSGPEDGASLQLSGWIWDFEPTPMDDSPETGKVVYKITIDNEGYILKVVTLSSSLTPSVEQYYRQAVERLTFSKTSAYQPAPTSTGTITFIIKSR